MAENKHEFVLLAIVAIVAIVGLVVLVMGTGTTKTAAGSDEALAGFGAVQVTPVADAGARTTQHVLIIDDKGNPVEFISADKPKTAEEWKAHMTYHKT